MICNPDEYTAMKNLVKQMYMVKWWEKNGYTVEIDHDLFHDGYCYKVSKNGGFVLFDIFGQCEDRSKKKMMETFNWAWKLKDFDDYGLKHGFCAKEVI